MRRILIACLLALLPLSAGAVEPDEILADPVLEARAREISKELRCVVCQNQDIDSSNAGVARDLRLLVRERLVAGDSDTEVIEFVRARYGDFVLLKPPFQPSTYALWIGPALIGLIALIVGWRVLASAGKRRGQDDLAPGEEDMVAEMLGTKEEGKNT